MFMFTFYFSSLSSILPSLVFYFLFYFVYLLFLPTPKNKFICPILGVEIQMQALSLSLILRVFYHPSSHGRTVMFKSLDSINFDAHGHQWLAKEHSLRNNLLHCHLLTL